MRVDHFNTFLTGGAANAARRLHQSLLAEKVESQFWHSRTAEGIPGDPSYKPMHWPVSWSQTPRNLVSPIWRKLEKKRLRRSFKGRPDGLEIFTTATRATATCLPAKELGRGVLNLHWIANFIDYPSFFGSIPATQPLVWTLHDMNPFTGGCHFSTSCEAFKTQCHNCPQLGRAGDNDLSSKVFAQKRLAFEGKNLHIVTPSRWLTGEASRSRLFDGARSFQTIPNGFDLDVFSPQDKDSARAALRLPASGTVLAFGADSVANRRKGFKELLAALSLIKSEFPLTGLIFGGGDIETPVSGLTDVRHLGYIADPARQALVYSAADIVVVPSLEDNLPNVGLEAMACGTAVVGFDVGGVPDFVRPGETGLLARPVDPADLAHQLSWLIEHPEERLLWGRQARLMMEREFSQATQARAYIRLYEQLLDRRETASSRLAVA